MREIKFRFYSQNGETGMWSISEQTLEDIENQDSWQGRTGNWQRIAVCQYTGLKDKNGKEIWENDIVKDVSKDSEDDLHFMKGCVKYLAPHFVLEIRHDFCVGMRNVPSEYEVIGNLYENPDLLESEVVK